MEEPAEEEAVSAQAAAGEPGDEELFSQNLDAEGTDAEKAEGAATDGNLEAPGVGSSANMDAGTANPEALESQDSEEDKTSAAAFEEDADSQTERVNNEGESLDLESGDTLNENNGSGFASGTSDSVAEDTSDVEWESNGSTADTANSEAKDADPAGTQTEETDSAGTQTEESDSDSGMEEAANDSTTNVLPESVETENLSSGYVPELDSVEFGTVLNKHTDFYYFHPEEGQEIPASSAEVTEWKKVKKGLFGSTKLESTDLVKMYLSYTIPAGALNETNQVARYRLPSNIYLTDDQIIAINGTENGMSALYADAAVKEDESMADEVDENAANYQKYLGAEAIEGTRTPDEKLKEGEQEYISAIVKAENVFDEEGLYGEKGAFLGQDLIFIFTPYSIEKNQTIYNADGDPLSAGEKVTGWFACDFNMSQIDWVEEDTDLDNSTVEKTAEVIFVEKDSEKNVKEISRTLKLVDTSEDQSDAANGVETEAVAETAAAETAVVAETAAAAETVAAATTASETAATDETALASTGNTSEQSAPEDTENGSFKSGTLTADGDGYRITLDYTEEAKIPENAELFVREITAETDKEAYEACLEQAGQQVAADEKTSVDQKASRFFDIEILVKDTEDNDQGETHKIEPAAPVSVNIQIIDDNTSSEDAASMDKEASQSEPAVLHFAEEGVEQIDSTVKTNEDQDDNKDRSGNEENEPATEISFEAESFSIYGVVYTVDFEYSVNGKMYQFSLPGGGFVSFTDLVEMLGIIGDTNADENEGKIGSVIAENGEENAKENVANEGAEENGVNSDTNTSLTLGDVEVSEATRKFVADVASVEFSNPELVDVSKVEADTTVGRIKESRGLECEYSAELTEEQIEEINAQTVEAGDWALISVQPFTSEETLTVTMKDGETFTIRVTDAQIRKTVIDAKGDTWEITVTYGEDSQIPDGAELKVEEILPEDSAYETYLQDALSTAGIGSQADYARFFDISIWYNREQVEPADSVSVSIKLADAPAGSEESLKVVHFEESGLQVMDLEKTVEDETGMTEMQFTTESFSVYGVIVEPGPTGTNDLDGRTFSISREGRYLLASTGDIGNQGDGATGFQKGSQSDAPVWKLEQVNGSTYYISTVIDGQTKYMNLTEHGNNRANASLSDTPQVFTVDAVNGGGYRLSAVINGKRYYLDEHNGTGGNGFAGYAGQSNNGILTFNFTSPVLENNNEYMVLVKQTADDGETDWYIVLNDGKLVPVEYDETTNKVKVDNPMLWYYTGDHIYHHSKEVGFKGNNLPSDYYYKYIDPSNASGLNEDNAGNTTQRQGDGPYIVPNGRNLWSGTSLTYTNHQIKSGNSNYYIGVNEDTTEIVGRVSQGSAAEIYLAKVTAVPESSNKNHTVNHIDISIQGGASLDVPLAYGDYYYTDHNGVRQTLTVSADNNVTLHLKVDQVDIEPKDMKNSEITAYSEKSGVLNDAFFVSGYSGNKENSVSTAQVRIEGSFKVADLDPYDNLWMHGDDEQGLSDQQLQDRLDNRIYYTVTVKKDVTFDWLYTYTDDQGHEHTVQLYDFDNNKGSTTSLINLSKSFDYWDGIDSPHWNGIENAYNNGGTLTWEGKNNPYTGNECPPIIEIDPKTHVQQWQKGHIVFNTAGDTGSGMDFKLEAQAVGDNNPAIEITKTLLTDTGEVLTPKSPVTNTFVVYQKRNASQSDYDSVINVGIEGEDTVAATDGIYNGYSGIHAKTVTVGQTGEGLVYDYDVKAGMTYIKEDENSIHKEIVDKDGKRWRYVRTYIDTEYAWRHDGDEDKLHHADGLISIPEAVGPYGTNLNNGFLPFFVYNVYERADDTVTLPVTKSWDDFAGSEYKWEATFKLQYMERQISEGEGTPVTTWTDYYPLNQVKLEKDAGSNQWSVSGSFGDLPKHRTDANGIVYERQYSADEVSFTVWKNNVLLYSYDGTKYTFGEGADESIYKPFYDHDANENWDGDWHLQISNDVGQKIEPRNIDIGLEKTWTPEKPADAAAKFILKRYKQTEFIDYQNVERNPDILVQLQDTQGNVLSHVYTKSGLPMYIDATFAPGKTGTLSFQYGTQTYNVSNTTASGTKVTVRSDPIYVTGSSGGTVVVQMTGGSLDLLAEGTEYNLRITDRHPNNDLALDSVVQEVTFPIAGKTGAEAWQYTFEHLPVEEGEWNSAGDYANMTIYSYYLEEDPDGTTGGYVPEIKDSAGNVISSTNRIYNSDTITVTNRKEPGITVTVRKVAKADVNNASAATLPGATFKLVKYTSSSYQQIDSSFEAVTIADNDNTISGVFTFNGLKEGYYQLEETVCPEGYVRTTSNPRFRVTTESGETVARLVNDNGTDIDSNASEMVVVENAESNHIVTVGNEPGAALPSTGGSGTRFFTILGSILILGAGVLLWRRRRLI